MVLEKPHLHSARKRSAQCIVSMENKEEEKAKRTDEFSQGKRRRRRIQPGRRQQQLAPLPAERVWLGQDSVGASSYFCVHSSGDEEHRAAGVCSLSGRIRGERDRKIAPKMQPLFSSRVHRHVVSLSLHLPSLQNQREV